MKYLKKFENHTAYTAAESSLILPNVSLCVQENEVHYNPYVDPYAGHAYVDLGLPSGTKWATMNVGASSPTDYGNYYKYGLGAEQYDKTQANYTGTENPLDSSVDTATQVWGGSWHMPTKTQFEELTANTTYEWTSIDGVYGGKFTATNGNYIFLPAAGFWDKGSQRNVGSLGYCWSSAPNPNNSGNAYYLLFDSGSKYMYNNYRRYGLSVRPVVG